MFNDVTGQSKSVTTVMVLTWFETTLFMKLSNCDLYNISYTDKFGFVLPKSPQSAWDVSERSQSDLTWERHLRDLLETSQKRWLFYDVFKTSQKHLKKEVFYVTSLRRLKNISKKMSFPWHFWGISRKNFWFFKIPHKNGLVWKKSVSQKLIK